MNAAAQANAIATPNYPSNYPNSASCTWVINAANGYSVMLNLTDFNLETGFGSCTTDYLEVRDGATSAATLLGKYCGTRSPFMIHSHGSSMYLKFVSDTTIVRKGFRATYQQGELDIFTWRLYFYNKPFYAALSLPVYYDKPLILIAAIFLEKLVSHHQAVNIT